MILSENQLKVPGKMYKVRIKCVSTRRLTTIEWLLLSCTQKFNKSVTMSGQTLKYAFEEVLQFQNSELLIKPCLRNLSLLKVIHISEDGNFDYNKLMFKDIEVTELGQYMLQEGLLPGEPREIPLDIYYNPLTGKMNNYFNGNPDTKDVVEFGTESDYDMDFPEERVINELQAGSVGGGRFTASKFRIEEIENLTSTDWECNVIMTVDVNEDGIITTNPEIFEDNVKNRISSLLLTKEINQKITNQLVMMDMDEVQNIVGSGKHIKQSILNICKNGKLIFMDATLYGLYKRNTASFKNTIIILFNDEEEFSIENDKEEIIVHIQNDFPVKGCAVIDEKGNHICLGKTEYMYEEKKVTVPLVYENKALSKKNKIVVEWLQNIIRKNCTEDIQFMALFTLPIFGGNQNTCKEFLLKRWDKMKVSEIIVELEKIHVGCMQLKTEMFQLNVFIETLIEKIDFSDYEKALQIIKAIMDTTCIRKNSEAHRNMIESLMNYVKIPTTYRDLFMLLQSLGITTHEAALQFDDLLSGLYTKTVMVDILTSIADGIFTKIPELFEYDAFFNAYQECISAIELHVSGLKLFEKSSEDEVKASIIACSDIASLQSYISELRSKNEYLLRKQKINIDEVLKKTMPIKAAAFMENIQLLEKYTEQTVNAIYEQTLEITNVGVKKRNGKKIYIVDTCALIHHPELLLYFSDEEYVRIPTKVIDELGKIKDKRNKKYGAELSETARMLAREIESTYLKIYNEKNKVRLMIENAAPELLPRELDPEVPDNQILSVALKYRDWETFIVSDDGVFRLAAMAQNITAMNSEAFIKEHKEYYKSLDERKKEHNTGGVYTNMASNKLEQKLSEGVENKKVIQGLSVDELPIRELKKYISDFNEPVLSYLQSNQVKTIGEFRNLTESKINNMPAKGKQVVYKNTIMRAVKQMDSITW